MVGLLKEVLLFGVLNLIEGFTRSGVKVDLGWDDTIHGRREGEDDGIASIWPFKNPALLWFSSFYILHQFKAL
jgi:hypothetical protein